MIKNARTKTSEGNLTILRQMLLSSKDSVRSLTIVSTKDQSNLAKRLSMLGSMTGISEIVNLLSKRLWIKFTIYRIRYGNDDASFYDQPIISVALPPNQYIAVKTASFDKQNNLNEIKSLYLTFLTKIKKVKRLTYLSF